MADAATVVRNAFAASAERLQRHDAAARAGDDPEAIHQARVATRRLRSDLRTFRTLLAEGWAGPLRDELGWIADSLGQVRDPDVLAARIESAAQGLDAREDDGVAALMHRLDEQRSAAHERLALDLRSDRYAALVTRVGAAAAEPAFAPAATGDAPAVLAPLVRKEWDALRKEVRRLDDEPPDAALHEVRIGAKRVRYACEAVAPELGEPTARFAAKVTKLQDVLGEHQDAVVAQEWLRVAAHDDETAAFAAGQLASHARTAAGAARDQWRDTWKAIVKAVPEW